MKTLCVKWSVVTVLALLLSLNGIAGAREGDSEGVSAASQGQSFIGSKAAIQDNAATPLTSSGTEMKTFDGSVSFNAQITCQSSSKFLELFAQPTATGDLGNVIISLDVNMDGTADQTIGFDKPISGVCGNGFISCDPGTWSNCGYYKWAFWEETPDTTTADTANSAYIGVKILPVGLADLGGCFCVNTSCGSNLVWNNLPMVLRALGGGIANTITQSAEFAITEAKIEGTSIRYYGNKPGSCTAASSGGVTASSLSKYYGNWAAIPSGAETVVQSQVSDPTSYYSLMTSVFNRTNTQYDSQTCNITRGTVVDQKDSSISGNGSYSICTDHFIYATIYDMGEFKYKLALIDSHPNGWQSMPHWNCGASMTVGEGYVVKPGHADYNGWHTAADLTIDPTQLQLAAQLPSGAVVLGTSGSFSACFAANSGSGCTGDGTGCVYGAGAVQQLSIVCPAAEAQTVTISHTYTYQAQVEYYTEGVTNNCSALEQNENCSLETEVVDEVITYSNFNPTGLAPLPSCRTIISNLGSAEICRDWWSKARTYRCKVGAFDFSDAKKRLNQVVPSATLTSETLEYSDIRKENEQWTSPSAHNATLYLKPGGDCEMACKVKSPRKDSSVGMAGNISNIESDTTTYDFYYRTCETSCPVSAGEVIVKDCQCINEFSEAATIMQALRTAGQDITCSSGVKRELTGGSTKINFESSK